MLGPDFAGRSAKIMSKYAYNKKNVNKSVTANQTVAVRSSRVTVASQVLEEGSAALNNHLKSLRKNSSQATMSDI